MSTNENTTKTEAVDGSWARSDALMNLLRRSGFGDMGRMDPEVRAVAARNATLSGWAREVLRERAGDRGGIDLLARSLGAIDETGRLVSHGVAADGTVPQLLALPIVRFVDDSRPAISACTRLQVPQGGPSFLRPTTTQPTLVAAQTETDVASSQRLQTSGTIVEKVVAAFAVSLSEQTLDFGGDLTVDSISRDVARSYAKFTSELFCGALESAITASAVLADNAASDVVMSTLAAGIPDFVSTAGVRPDLLFCSTARFAQLAGLSDTSARPVPPELVADSLKVTLVIDSAFADATLAFGASSYLEWYEPDMPKIMSIGAPSTAELVISFSSAVASFTPAEALFGFTLS